MNLNLSDHQIASIFPLMPANELQEMAEDIKAHGQRMPIVIYEGKILDGRNRYRACALAGVDVVTEDYTGDDPVGEVLSLNLHRRNLTPSQKAMIGQSSLPHFEAEAKKRMHVGRPSEGKANLPEDNGHQARDAAAAIVGVSPRLVSDAKRVAAEAPELAEKIKQGELTVNAAITEIKKRNEAEPEKATTKLPKWRPSRGNELWLLAWAKLETITPDDTQFEEAMNKALKYITKRIQENK